MNGILPIGSGPVSLKKCTMMIFRKKQTDKTVQFNTEKVFLAATQPLKLVYGYFCTTPHGLSEEDAEERLKSCGENKIVQETRPNPLLMFVKPLSTPLSVY